MNTLVPVFLSLLLVVLLASPLVTAASTSDDAEPKRDVSKLSSEHAKVLLELLHHRATTSPKESLRTFFEPSPQDHCCNVWANLRCAATIAGCVTTCASGAIPACMLCLGPLWEECCCCLDNAGIHSIRHSCPGCCNN